MSHVAVCMATMAFMPAATSGNLGALCAQTVAGGRKLGVTDFTLHTQDMTYIPVSRESLAVKALDAGATHILWLDHDMRFPTDAALRLLARGQSYVGALYPRRGPPTLTTAYTMAHTPMKRGGTGLEKAVVMGLGVCLIGAEVFAAIPHPWFESGYREGKFRGEDENLCERALAAGFQPYVDHDLSREVRHIAQVEYGYDDIIDDPEEVAHATT